MPHLPGTLWARSVSQGLPAKGRREEGMGAEAAGGSEMETVTCGSCKVL